MKVQISNLSKDNNGHGYARISNLGDSISQDQAERLVGALWAAVGGKGGCTIAWIREAIPIKDGLIKDSVVRQDEIIAVQDWSCGIFRVSDPKELSRVATVYKWAWALCMNTPVFLCFGEKYSSAAQHESIQALAKVLPGEADMPNEDDPAALNALLSAHSIASLRYYDGDELFLKGHPNAMAACYERLKSAL